MARHPLSDPAGFRSALNRWFGEHGRDYPWRRTRDPYPILVSEVMLQQTRIATVLERGYFTRFLERFPDLATLAAAGDDELLRSWEGLGYYRRARMLRATARAVIERHQGRFPADPGALAALPGIGRYTAGALLSFAFERPAPIVDGNIARVLSRLFDLGLPVDTEPGRGRLWEWAAALVDPAAPRVFNSALMELGQAICLPGRPSCGNCPVRAFCLAGDPGALPLRKPRPRPTEIEEHALFARRDDGAVLLQRARGGRRDGLWQLPLRPPEPLADLPLVATTRYPITRYRVTLRIHRADPARVPPPPAGAEERWHPADRLARAPMAAPFRKALDSLLAKVGESRKTPPRDPAAPPD